MLLLTCSRRHTDLNQLREWLQVDSTLCFPLSSTVWPFCEPLFCKYLLIIMTKFPNLLRTWPKCHFFPKISRPRKRNLCFPKLSQFFFSFLTVWTLLNICWQNNLMFPLHFPCIFSSSSIMFCCDAPQVSSTNLSLKQTRCTHWHNHLKPQRIFFSCWTNTNRGANPLNHSLETFSEFDSISQHVTVFCSFASANQAKMHPPPPRPLLLAPLRL